LYLKLKHYIVSAYIKNALDKVKITHAQILNNRINKISKK